MKLSRRSFALGVVAAPFAAACGSTLEAGPRDASAGDAGNPEDGGTRIEDGSAQIPDSGTTTCKLEALTTTLPRVNASNAAQHVLYSWTTAAQIDELRTNPTLLTRSLTANGDPGTLWEDLTRRANAGSNLAVFLTQNRYAKNRFAWVSPVGFAHVNGKDFPYGDRLLKITLRSDAIFAIVGRFDILFVDGNNQQLPFDAVNGAPERLGAIYYDQGTACDEFNVSGDYREYLIPNEAMIERWEYATPAIVTTVTESAKAAADLATSLAPCLPAERCGTSTQVIDAFALVFSAGEVTGIAAALHAFPAQGTALTVTPAR